MDAFKYTASPGHEIRLAPGNLDKYSKMSGLALQNLYYIQNRTFPNCYMFSTKPGDNEMYFDTAKVYEAVMAKYGQRSWWDRLFNRANLRIVTYKAQELKTNKAILGLNFWLKKENIFARVEKNVSESYILYGHEDNGALGELVKIMEESYTNPVIENNNLFLVAQNEHGFNLNKYQINAVKNFDVAKLYNDDFQKPSEIIDKFIKDENKGGLVILHGEKGTGKTTYIRHIISDNPGKKFVFVPSNMISMLGDPAFGNFLLTLKDSIIILEDCEDVIRSRKSSSQSSSAVSLLLNMGDGLLSDGLSIKFICTFNENISNIDDALLRKGRLACKYEFKELSAEKANNLLMDIYNDRDIIPTTTKPMSLADIYNIDAESYSNERKKII